MQRNAQLWPHLRRLMFWTAAWRPCLLHLASFGYAVQRHFERLVTHREFVVQTSGSQCCQQRIQVEPASRSTSRMASGRMARLLTVLMVLALQWTSPHARSMPGDFDTLEYVPTDQEYPGFPQDTGSSAQFDTPVFTAQTGDAFGSNPEIDNSDATNWDAETFNSQDPVASHSEVAQYNSYAATEGELPYDVLIDSPESVREPPSTSFAGEVVYHSKAAYMNDEVFYDTSAADIIYKANDEYVHVQFLAPFTCRAPSKLRFASRNLVEFY